MKEAKLRCRGLTLARSRNVLNFCCLSESLLSDSGGSLKSSSWDWTCSISLSHWSGRQWWGRHNSSLATVAEEQLGETAQFPSEAAHCDTSAHLLQSVHQSSQSSQSLQVLTPSVGHLDEAMEGVVHTVIELGGGGEGSPEEGQLEGKQGESKIWTFFRFPTLEGKKKKRITHVGQLRKRGIKTAISVCLYLASVWQSHRLISRWGARPSPL